MKLSLIYFCNKRNIPHVTFKDAIRIERPVPNMYEIKYNAKK